MAQQFTLLASGPIESKVVDKGKAPDVETRAAVGLNPVRPHSAEGIRTDPPVSVPIPATAMLSLTETAAPLEDPPGIRASSLFQGFKGVP